jgi:hypothetical protein
MTDNTAEIIDELLTRIRQVPGKKLAVLVLNVGSVAIDIDPNGVCGYSRGDEPLFKAKLARALHKGGGLMLVSHDAQGKTLYGAFLGDGGIRVLSAEEVRHLSCTNPATGAPMEPEEGVTYAAFPGAHGPRSVTTAFDAIVKRRVSPDGQGD